MSIGQYVEQLDTDKSVDLFGPNTCTFKNFLTTLRHDPTHK